MNDDSARAMPGTESLASQLKAAQEANTRLIARIVELEEVCAKLRSPQTPAVVPPSAPTKAESGEHAIASVASQLAAMIIQRRLEAGGRITFAFEDQPRDA